MTKRSSSSMVDALRQFVAPQFRRHAILGSTPSMFGRRSMVAEAFLIAAIIMATSMLGQTPPPRALEVRQGGSQPLPVGGGRPIVLEAASGNYVLKMEIDPGMVGQNRMTVRVSDGKGNPMAAQETTTLWSLPHAGIEGLARPLSPSVDGEYSGIVDLPVGGNWGIQVNVLVSDFEKTVFRAEVEISEP